MSYQNFIHFYLEEDLFCLRCNMPVDYCVCAEVEVVEKEEWPEEAWPIWRKDDEDSKG